MNFSTSLTMWPFFMNLSCTFLYSRSCNDVFFKEGHFTVQNKQRILWEHTNWGEGRVVMGGLTLSDARLPNCSTNSGLNNAIFPLGNKNLKLRNIMPN